MLKPSTTVRNQEATLYVGNLDEKVTEAILWELMIQAGPVAHAHIPRDRVTQQHQGYGFVEFQSEEDAEYAMKILTGIRLYGKPLRLNKSSADKKSLDVGANLFIGNLAPDADEKLLFDTFILFGTLIQTPKVARDEATGVSKGYGFLSYDSFEAADAAIEAMNGQYLCNRPITVNYAFKKDGKGERHGSAAERLLAAQSKKANQTASGTPGVTVGSSQFALQMQMQMQQMHQQAQLQQMQTMTPSGTYPSNVPASMYYSTNFPTHPLGAVQPSFSGYPTNVMPPGFPAGPTQYPAHYPGGSPLPTYPVHYPQPGVPAPPNYYPAGSIIPPTAVPPPVAYHHPSMMAPPHAMPRYPPNPQMDGGAMHRPNYNQ